MHIMIRKIMPAVFAAFLCVGTAFPAFAEGTVKTDAGVEAAGHTGGTVPDIKADAGSPDKAAAVSSDKSGSTASDQAENIPLPEDGYVDAGPGAKKKPEKKEAPKPKETSLGTFTITGYCGCSKCSGSHGLTYSGTVPTANHTISADLNLFPLGTKLKIDGIIYTVEDKGSAVKGKTLDIYYDTHDEALAKGRYSAEVFLMNE